MANFTIDDELNNLVSKLGRMELESIEITKSMIEKGQNIMCSTIKSHAKKYENTMYYNSKGKRVKKYYKNTEGLVNSIKASKVVENKEGDIVGRVKFYGYDKNKTPNALKAMAIEYGTSNGETAKPFVRPAIIQAKESISQAMEKEFETRTKKYE